MDWTPGSILCCCPAPLAPGTSHSSRSAFPRLAIVFLVGLGVGSWVCGGEWVEGPPPRLNTLAGESVRVGSTLHPQHLTDCTILDNDSTCLSLGFPAMKGG